MECCLGEQVYTAPQKCDSDAEEIVKFLEEHFGILWSRKRWKHTWNESCITNYVRMSRIKAGCSREIPTWDMVTIPPIREPGATEKFSPPAHPDEDGEKERMGYRVLISPMSSSYVQKGIQTASWGLQGQYQEQVLFIPVPHATSPFTLQNARGGGAFSKQSLTLTPRKWANLRSSSGRFWPCNWGVLSVNLGGSGFDCLGERGKKFASETF